MSKLLSHLGAVAASLALSACAVGPKAPVPGAPPSAAGPFVSSRPETAANAPARNDWWRLYEDPAVDRLVTQALANNNELEAASANLRAVRASLRETRGDRLPRFTTTASASRQQPSASALGPAMSAAGRPEAYETYDAGLEVSYEVDLWGRIAAAVRAARADANAAQAALEVLQVSVAAETARAYADACAANAQIAVAERTLALQNRTADLVERQRQAGGGDGLDVARARSAAASTAAAIPPLRAQRDGALFRLGTLVGVPPKEVDSQIRACGAVPRVAQAIPVGDGESLLARRPDVRRAEQEVAAAAARVNVAVASLYPSITLGGSAGATALDIADLGKDDNFRFSIGPLISWSIASPGTSRARVERADANLDAALARFDQTVLVALQETETALSAYAAELDRNRALSEARARAADAARLAEIRFQAGSDSFLAVLDAQRTLAQAEMALSASQGALATAQISVFKALAGGWDAGPRQLAQR
jgi:NodT family efflux transporter outer membrane factor (OMF) lipoprotein